MLSKIIKFDFKNRFVKILMMYVFALAVSVGALFTDFIIDSEIFNNKISAFLEVISASLIIAFMCILFKSVFMQVEGFGKRFFKDQGYLTNTLPVKTSTHMLGRLINDILSVATMYIAYTFCFCVLSEDFSIYGNLYDSLVELFELKGNEASAFECVLLVLLNMILFLLLPVLAIWHFNFAYTLGHCGGKNKKLKSIIWYGMLYMVYEIAAVIVITFLAALDVLNVNNDVTVGEINGILAVAILLVASGIAVSFLGTIKTFDSRFNIE